MLAHEWRELEELCEHIATLRERRAAAHRTGNTGLIEGIEAEMDRTARQREHLVRHISTQLGSAAADRPLAADPAAGREPSGSAPEGGRDTILPPPRD